MNNDLISREEALRVINAYDCRELTVEDVIKVTDGCANEIIKLPTIDAEPVRHGRIIETIENGKFKRIFSCCGKNFTRMTTWMTPRYCPNCGAKMDGE